MVSVFSRVAGTTCFVGRIAAGLSVALVLVLVGCASVPPPDNAMNLAQGQLQAARDAHAPDYAPVDMGFAQDKFQQAQNAMAQREYANAATLAAESQADAELAAAKGRLGTARAQVQQKISENSRLRGQGEPATVDRTPAMKPAAPASNQSLLVGQLQDLPAPAESAPSAAGNGPQTSPMEPQQPSPAESTMSPLPSAGFQPIQSQELPAPAQSAPPAPSSEILLVHLGQTQGARP